MVAVLYLDYRSDVRLDLVFRREIVTTLCRIARVGKGKKDQEFKMRRKKTENTLF